MIEKYDNVPVLLIGLGGIGSQIVDSIYVILEMCCSVWLIAAYISMLMIYMALIILINNW